MPTERSPKDTMEMVITSVPVDSTAARVTSQGTKYEHEPSGPTVLHSDLPLPIVSSFRDHRPLIGKRFGRFTVIGTFAERRNRLVVRCDCSRYETRSARAIKNPNNAADACLRCRQTLYLKRTQHFRSTGHDIEVKELI